MSRHSSNLSKRGNCVHFVITDGFVGAPFLLGKCSKGVLRDVFVLYIRFVVRIFKQRFEPLFLHYSFSLFDGLEEYVK